MTILERLHLGSSLGRPEDGVLVTQPPLWVREKWLVMPMEVTETLAGTGIDEETMAYIPSISGMLAPMPEPSAATKRLFCLGR